MILFLEYSAGGVRGGELYNNHIHSFMKKNYRNVVPDEILNYPRGLANPLSHALYSLKQVKKIKPDIIVFDVSSGIRNILALRWMKKNSKRAILIIQEERPTFRQNNIFYKWVVRAAEIYLARNSDIIIVNSKYSANLAKRKKARSNTPIIIVHPGMENFISQKPNIAVTDDSVDETIELLNVGVCKKQKGIKYLVEAINSLSDLDLKLHLVGKYDPKSGYYNNIIRYIKRNSLEEKIIFHGFVEQDELLDLYMKCKIYAHPSLMEGYGMVLAEAMSFGLPIIASTAGAIPELITDDINGILVKPADSKSLASAIRKLSERKDLRVKFSRNNLERVKKLFTWEDFDQRLEKELVPTIEQITGIRTQKDNIFADPDK